MKRFLAFLMACMMLLLCACGGGDAAAEPTPALTPEPTPVVDHTPKYVHPLNGSLLDEPYTGRVFASTICNTDNAVPHISLNKADVVFEMYVNSYVIRDLALFSDIKNVETFGSVRSTRPMFHQLAGMYDFILLHSGGSNYSMNDAFKLGIDDFNIEQYEMKNAGTSYRDVEYNREYEASLFGVGEACYSYAETLGMRLEQPADMDYGLNFTDEGTPENGEAAKHIVIDFDFKGSDKYTEMKYDSDTDKYVYHQYGQEMRDLITDEQEAFTNVIAITAKMKVVNIYQKAEYTKGGQGWYACGGKLIPIAWSSAEGKGPLEFFLEDGTPLEIERGNTYIAIMPEGQSQVTWTE